MATASGVASMRPLVFKLHLLCALMLLCMGWSAHTVQSQTVCVVRGGDYPEFRDAALGFWDVVAEGGYGRSNGGEEHLLLPETLAEVVGSVRKQSPALIFSVGTRASRSMREAFPETPLVFALAFDPVSFDIVDDLQHPSPYASGVLAAVPLATQWKTLKAAFSDLNSVGILYSKNGIVAFEEVRDVLLADGVAIEAHLIGESGDPTAALAQMHDIDLFWMTPDRTAFLAHNREAIFRLLRKRNVPIFAPSPKFLHGRYGADIAISVDPRQNGRQAARIALKFLTDKVQTHAPEAPEDWSVFVKAGSGIAPSGDNVVYVR